MNAVAKEMGVSVYPAMRVLPGARTLANYEHTREISRWANENEVGSVSPIITVDNKYFFVVGLRAIHPEGYAPYAEVASTIKSYLMVQKKGELSTRLACPMVNGSNDPGKMTFLFIIFGYVFFDDKVVDDEVLALHGVLAHVVFQKFRHLVALAQRDFL